MTVGPDDLLVRHLADDLGRWPPRAALDVVGSARREQPGWDGHVRDVVGVADATGAVVLSVPPRHVAAVRDLADGWGSPGYAAGLDAVLGHRAPHRLDATGVFRWAGALPEQAPEGEWVDRDDPRVPPWLRPFNGGVLVAWDDEGRYGAGVGIKHHDDLAAEIAVGTEPALRGRGVARRLVVTAARAIQARGQVALYLHAPDNTASAHVARAAGFPDRGWHAVGFHGPHEEP